MEAPYLSLLVTRKTPQLDTLALDDADEEEYIVFGQMNSFFVFSDLSS